MLFGSTSSTSSNVRVARSMKPALLKSVPSDASAYARSARVRSDRASSP